MDTIGAMTSGTTTATAIEIRPFHDEDWPSVRAIYGQSIATRNATYENRPPDL
jgi:L-amino acid N-acyltransferase YncA